MELGLWEILAVALLAFLVLGPVEMLRYYDKLTKYLGKMRSELNNFKVLAQEEVRKLDREAELSEARKKVEEVVEQNINS